MGAPAEGQALRSLQMSPYCDYIRDNGCTCPPHIDGIGREKWPDCPVHNPDDTEGGKR